MKNLLQLLIILVLSVNQSFSQPAEAISKSKPASTNVRVAEFPRILPDSRIIFRVDAPDAPSVQIDIGGKIFDMSKAEDGLWYVTTDPQVPGFHYYSVVIGGLRVADPSSQSFFGMERMASGIEIPEKGVDYYFPKNVLHGDVRSKIYFSEIAGNWRRAFIYCPPGYDVDVEKKYPVLYLQHGGGEDETGWVIQGKVDIILDNLIAEGKAKPMLVVMDEGYANDAGDNDRFQRGNDRWSAFENVLIHELIPFIDENFRTVSNRGNRAMAGLSMGSNQTFTIGFKNQHIFSYLGIFSVPRSIVLPSEFDDAIKDADGFNSRMNLLWISVGTEELPNLTKTKQILEQMDTGGIKYEFYESPGTAHEWLTWRRSLHQFAPLLFKD